MEANVLSNNALDNKKWEFLNIWNNLSSINKEYQFSSDSYMIVTDELVNKLRGSLKPHQGFKIVC